MNWAWELPWIITSNQRQKNGVESDGKCGMSWYENACNCTLYWKKIWAKNKELEHLLMNFIKFKDECLV